MVVALAETGVATALYFPRFSSLRLLSVSWLAASFTVYRLGWWLSKAEIPCLCLGTGFRWWPWLNKNHAQITVAVFVLLEVLIVFRIMLHFLRSGEARNPVPAF